MRTLLVYIEINGVNEFVGKIVGENSENACFTYDPVYLNNSEHRAISIGLPLEEKTFNASRTKVFLRACFRKVLQEKVLQSGCIRMKMITYLFWLVLEENVLEQ